LNTINFPPSFVTEYILVNHRSGESPVSFQPGEVLRATVVDLVDSLHTLIRIKGEEILVENRAASLTQGRELALQVEEIQPKVILKIIPEEEPTDARVESFLMKYLSSDRPLEELAEKLAVFWDIPAESVAPEVHDTLKQLFSLFTLFSPLLSSSGPRQLQEIVAQSGLFWEAKLKGLIEGAGENVFDSSVKEDLKNLLLKLEEQLNSLIGQQWAESAGIENWRKTLEQFVNKIELYQVLNLRQPESTQNVLVLLPLWVQNSLQFLELNFSFPRPGAGSSAEEESTIIFLLHFPDWGKMKVEARVRGKSLYCSFTVSDPKIKEFLDRALPELSARLRPIGYGVRSLVSLEKVENIAPSLIPEVERWQNPLLNLIV